MMFGPWVRPVAWYQSGSAIGLPQAPLVVLGDSPPPFAALTSQVGTPVVVAQIACSCTVVPGVPPRETKFASPAAPAVATFWNASVMFDVGSAPLITPAGSPSGRSRT